MTDDERKTLRKKFFSTPLPLLRKKDIPDVLAMGIINRREAVRVLNKVQALEKMR